MQLKHADNELLKARRKAFAARHEHSESSEQGLIRKRRNEKESLIDLSKKDNKSGRGRYV